MLFPNGKWLMCCPDHYDVVYEINPWMKVDVSPGKKNAWSQWKNLHHTILRLGGWVEYVHAAAGLPDMVFTANAGLVKGKKCVLSRFRYKERQGEEPLFKRWFEDHGFEVHVLRDDEYYEGEGDSLFAGDRLFGACGFRSERKSYDAIASFLGVKEVICCDLVDPSFYHLDTCFCPLNDRQAIFCRSAFSAESIKRMENAIELIEVPPEDAKKFACNAVILGRDIVIPAGCEATRGILAKLGFATHEVELNEFIKAGGAAKCLSLRVG